MPYKIAWPQFKISQAQALLPQRTRNSHKADGGRCLIIAGGPGMWGAGVLTALAATRIGSGYTYCANSLNLAKMIQNPDLLHLPLNYPLKNLNQFTSIIFGPGIKSSLLFKKIFFQILEECSEQSILLDAGALDLLSELNQKSLPKKWILTPHVGEWNRLMKNKKLKLNKNSSIEEKKAALFQAQKTLQCHILLKGYPNLILGPHLQGSLIKSGTPALAKAGTGDVLSGMIGGLMAQGLETFQAAQLGAFIHGEISKLWVKEKDPISLRPTDLIELMPSYLKSLRACKSLS